MKKYNDISYKTESNNIPTNEKEKEKTEQFSKNNKINNNSIINKIHSIQASINNNNNNNNNSKYAHRKNNFRRNGNDYKTQENNKKSKTKSKSKNKNKLRSKSKLKNLSNNKLINESQNITQNKNNSVYNKISHIYDYTNPVTDKSNCSNMTNNSFFTNNTTASGINTNNNIIITINNYNKITPTNIDHSSKTIPIQKPKDNNGNGNGNNKKKENKKIKYSTNDNNKNATKKIIHKNKKENEKKVYNYYINAHNLSVDNGQNNVYNNNIFLNHLMNNKNDKNINNVNNNNDNNDNVSINTYNTINESNNNISSSNNTTNREYSNRTLIKKNNNYQDNIILKKKQLGMYSPLSILKRNFEIPTKTENEKQYNNKQNIDTVNSFNITENNIKYDEITNSNNNENDENKDTDKDLQKNINNTNNNKDINKNRENDDNNKNKYNFNYYNINKNKNNNKNKKINNYNNEIKQNENSRNITNNNTNKNLANSNMNKNQVKNILSKIKQIKNTKQIYNNKKAFAFTKIHRKKEKAPLYSINNSYFLKSRPSYSRLTDRNINNNQYFYYSRSNSKNVLSNRNKNLNLRFFNFSHQKASKSNQKLIDRSFMSETDRMDKKKSTNELLLSYQKKRNKMYIFKNINAKSNNIKAEKTYNENDSKKKSIYDINDECLTLNSSMNSNKNINNKNYNLDNNTNMKNILNKNNTSNTVSISTNIDMPSNNNKIIDTYESTTIANINKHCDSLLSKINQKMKEKEMEKEKEKENSNGKENEFKEYNGYIEFEDNYNKIKNSEEKKNKVIYKKIISNASLSRRGLNRPDEVMKTNQDTLFKVKFGDINYSYYGVCDGHGPSGHFVSDFIKSNIAFIVYKHLKSLLLQNQNNNSSNLNEVDDSNIDFSKLFKDCFLLMDSKLSENKSIDIELSGTTCVSLLFCDNRIISANVGDSRAIKGQYNIKTNNWDYIALTRDHKPSEKDEAERIKKSKGIIHPYIDDDGNYAGPDRVWKDDELPGLAMSRSFGDEIASSVGVFSEPEVKIFPFNEEDKFIVIASDGLWEYVTNEEVTDIVSEYFEKKDCDGAVSKLYEISHERWVQYDDYIDDISIIVVFLE